MLEEVRIALVKGAIEGNEPLSVVLPLVPAGEAGEAYLWVLSNLLKVTVYHSPELRPGNFTVGFSRDGTSIHYKAHHPNE